MQLLLCEINTEFDIMVNEESIKYIENELNIKFPKEYVEIVKKHNGSEVQFWEDNGRKMDSKIKIDSYGESSVHLLKYSDVDKMKYSEIVNAKEACEGWVPDPKKIIPFSEDGGGKVLFFDYRKNKNEPSILFIDHEQCFPEEYVEEKSLAEWQEETLHFVAKSFHELLQKIELDEYLGQ